MPDGSLPQPDAAPHAVAHTLPCVGCGYDLVGLAEDTVCPECGVPIGRSISGDHLFASSKEHREELARGARLALIGIWAGWVCAPALAAYALVVNTGLNDAALLVAGPLALGLFAALTCSGLGWLALTTSDPDNIADATQSWVPRAVLRLFASIIGYAAVLLVLGWLLLDAALHIRGPSQGLTSMFWPLALLLTPACALSKPISLEIAGLARRLIEGELAQQARNLPALGWLAIVALALAYALSLRGLPGWWWLLEPVAWALAGVAVLAWAVHYHTLVRSLRVALAAVAARP